MDDYEKALLQLRLANEQRDQLLSVLTPQNRAGYEKAEANVQRLMADLQCILVTDSLPELTMLMGRVVRNLPSTCVDWMYARRMLRIALERHPLPFFKHPYR